MKTALLFITLCLSLIAPIARAVDANRTTISAIASTTDCVWNGFVTMPSDGRIKIGAMGVFPTNGSISFRMNALVLENYRNILTTNRYGNNGIRFELYNGGTFNAVFGRGGGLQGIPSPVLTPNTWYHVVLTWNQTNRTGKLYIDGVLTATETNLTEFYSAYDDVQIGVGFDDSRHFRGSLDEVAFWTKELSELEVAGMQSGPLTGGELDLRAYYNMNQSGSGVGLTVLNNAIATAGLYNGTTVGDVVFSPNDPPTLSLAPTSGTLTCTNPSLTLTATSSATALRWSTLVTSTSITVNSGGGYSVTATGANGCTAVASSVISQSTTPPVASLVASGTLTCAVGSITLTAAAGSGNTYVFAGPTGGPSGVVQSAGNSATVNVGGVYSVTITNAATGCSNTATTTVESNTTVPTPTLNANFGATLTCSQLSLTLTGTGGAGVPGNPYRFAGPGNSLSGITSQNQSVGTAVVNASGLYSVTVINTSTGCFSTNSLSVSQNSSGSLSISLTANNILSCSNPNPSLMATPGAANYWFSGPDLNQNGPNNTATASTTGVFSVTATSGGCSSSASITLTGGAGTPPNALLFGNGSLSCQTPTVSLTAVGGSRYRFSGPDGLSAGIVSQMDGRESTQVNGYLIVRTPIPTVGTVIVNQPGTYTVLVTDANGCSATATIVVTGTACPNGQ